MAKPFLVLRRLNPYLISQFAYTQMFSLFGNKCEEESFIMAH